MAVTEGKSQKKKGKGLGFSKLLAMEKFRKKKPLYPKEKFMNWKDEV